MKGVSIKCPNCAARLSVKSDQDDATCTYCGTAVVVRRRSKILERPLPPPKTAPVGRPVVTARRSSAGVLGMVLFILVLLAAPIFGVVKHCSHKIGFGTDWTWDGVDSVILADVNGDGTLDAIGRVRVMQPDDMIAMAAFDGRNGKRLWKSEKLGARGDVLHTVSGLAPGVLIAGGGVGELIALGSADGSEKWRIRLAEKVEHLCAGPKDGTFVAQTADKRAQVIALADGRVEGTVEVERCEALPSDATREEAPDRVLTNNHSEAYDWVRELEGMYASNSILHPPSGVTIAVGYKQPGTQIPMIARYTPGEERGKAVVSWSALVPAVDPLSVPTSSAEPEDTAVDGEGVAVAYNVKFAHFYRVTLFAVADGRRLWDAEVPGERPMSAVRMSPTHVFVSTWGGLYAYDRTTGKRVYTIE